MNFASAQSYLLGLINETASRRAPNRLDRIRAFVAALGEPQLRYPTLHVAGTSGKGSTATMLAAALEASGKRVGLHTKPHLASPTERMRIQPPPLSTRPPGRAAVCRAVVCRVCGVLCLRRAVLWRAAPSSATDRVVRSHSVRHVSTG